MDYPTIKELLEQINYEIDKNPNAEITGVSREFCSYRGYYSHLAMAPSSGRIMSLVEFYNVLYNQIGQVYYGYKGGEYTMYDDRYLFMAHYGRMGQQVIGIEYDEVEDLFVLKTSELDYNGL